MNLADVTPLRPRTRRTIYMSTGAAAKLLGVGSATVNRWCHTDPRFVRPHVMRTLGGHYRLSNHFVEMLADGLV